MSARQYSATLITPSKGQFPFIKNMLKVQTFTEPLKLLHRLPLVHFKHVSIDIVPTYIQLVELLVNEAQHFTAIRQTRLVKKNNRRE